jgi:hypothetical protein
LFHYHNFNQMGRERTGAIFTSEARRLDLSFLLKEGFIKKNAKIQGVINWSIRDEPTGSMTIVTKHTPNEKWIRVSYTATDLKGVKTDYDYQIDLVEVDSNLGKGKVLYMICPESGRRCRILYLAYWANKFKCREAYQNRLYFSTQKCSKLDFWNTKYFETVSKIEKFGSLRTTTHKGKPTKRALRYDRLMIERNYCDVQRWEGFEEKYISKSMKSGRYNDLL